MEEGEQNLSSRIIEPPKDRITNYYDNVREWRKRYWATPVDREEPGPAEIANKKRAGLEAVDKINTKLHRNHQQGRQRRKNSKKSNKLR